MLKPGAFATYVDELRKHKGVKRRSRVALGYHRFLIEKLLESIDTLELREERKGRFLIGLCSLLVTIGIAPYIPKVSIPPSAVGFVGVFGLWGAGYAYYYVYQYLKVRGIVLKDKARYYRQICLSRGYLLQADEGQWRYSVLPIGLDYSNYHHSKKQRWAGDWTSPKYLSLFIAYVSIGLGFMATWFMAHVLSALRGNQAVASPELTTAFLCLAPCVPVAIHIFGRACFYYHRAIAEAMRIRPEDPNPELDVQPQVQGMRKFILVGVIALAYGIPAGVGLGCAIGSTTSYGFLDSFGVLAQKHKWLAVLLLSLAGFLHAYFKASDVIHRIRAGSQRWHSAD